tara:strand:- start:2723 stop:5500 length:2778 start_codon:yes stop_codon:yes gene_type:complete
MSLQNLKEKINEIVINEYTEESISNEDINYSQLINILNNNKYFKNDELIEDLSLIFSKNINYRSFISILPHDFKYTKYYNFFDFVTLYLIDYYNIYIKNEKDLYIDPIQKKFFSKILCNLLNILIISNKGQHFLNKLIKNINNLNFHFTENIDKINASCSSGTIMTYLFCHKAYLSNKKNIITPDHILESFYLSLGNSDCRIYKHFLKDKYNIKLIRNKIESDYNYLRRCLQRVANISINGSKYFLKRLKIIDDIFNIKPYFGYFKHLFSDYIYISTIPFYLTEHYLLKMHKNDVIYIKSYFINFEMNNALANNQVTYSKLIKQSEKFNSKRVVDSLKYLINDEFNDDTTIPTMFLRNLITCYGISDKNIFNKYFIKYVRQCFLQKPVYIKDISLKYLLIADCINHKFVKQLYIIRRFLGKILKIQKLSNEFVRKFNDNKQEFNDDKQEIFEFNTIPPKHLLTDGLDGELIIRPKADGTLVSSINRNVEPKNLLSRYILKAEYIESLDLYLVFDINLPNKSPLERYIFLRSIHPYTKNYTMPYKLENLENFITYNSVEDKILQNFLSNTSGYRWYPKASFIGNLKQNDITLLTRVSTNSSKFHSKIYPNDGFVVVSTNKTFKIKPLDHMTIDITFNSIDNTWRDREGNNLSIYMNPTKKYIQTNIWRCYPDFSGSRLKFENREIRFDKRRANPHNVVMDIINYLNKKCFANYYQKNLKPSLSNLKIIKRQNLRFNQLIERFYRPNKIWLDLGCGKGKLLHQLNDIIIYFGIDNDNYLVTNNKQKFKRNKRAIFKTVDINDEDLSKILPPIKFNYIVMNHSINHFYSKELVNFINKVTDIGSYIIFNTINEKLENTKVLIDNGYICNDGIRTRYLFPWTHRVEVSEKYTKLNDILSNFDKFKLIENKRYVETPFESIYSWIVLKRV